MRNSKDYSYIYSTTEIYFVSGEMVSDLANDETKFIIKFHDTRDDDYDIDTNILNLKTIKFENNTLYIQARND